MVLQMVKSINLREVKNVHQAKDLCNNINGDFIFSATDSTAYCLVSSNKGHLELTYDSNGNRLTFLGASASLKNENSLLSIYLDSNTIRNLNVLGNNHIEIVSDDYSNKLTFER